MTSRSAALADLAGLLADRTRATFCLALMDGRAWTAGELAAHAGVTHPTASEHLDRLVAGGLLVQRRQGRHRYLQLADAHTAALVEGMVAHTGPGPERGDGLRSAIADAALTRGRTCYDHLAGRVGVALTDALTGAGLLARRDGVTLTEAGVAWFTGPLGVDEAALRGTRRPTVRVCLDWTERRDHLAGAAGAQLCGRLLARGWVQRVGSGRAVRVTPAGGAALRDLLGLDPAELV